MPASEGLHREREERDTYVRTGLESGRHLPVVGVVERCRVVYCATVDEGGLEWRRDTTVTSRAESLPLSQAGMKTFGEKGCGYPEKTHRKLKTFPQSFV